MTSGKEGAQFVYPNSLMWLPSYPCLLPYRQLEGFFSVMSVHIEKLKVSDYTTMHWRVVRTKAVLNPEVYPERDVVVITVDSAGIKVANRGEWIRDKWKKRLYQDTCGCRYQDEKDTVQESNKGKCD